MINDDKNDFNSDYYTPMPLDDFDDINFQNKLLLDNKKMEFSILNRTFQK